MATSAWARFGYKVLATVVLTVTKTVLRGASTGLTDADIWRIVWTTLYDLREVYNQVVRARTQQACSGLQLIMGGENPFAKVVYHQCMAGGASFDAYIDLALKVFVEIPMIKCACVDSQGADLLSFLMDHCAPALPLTMQPALQMVGLAARRQASAAAQRAFACDALIQKLRDGVQTAMDPFFQHQFDSLEALGGAVDYLLIPFNSRAGDCLNFNADSHVVVIVPYPTEYFSECASTSICKRKCAPEWTDFSAARALEASGGVGALPEITVQAESLFFPGSVSQQDAVNNVTALTEVNGSGWCQDRSNGAPVDRAVVLAELGLSGLGTQMWCIPMGVGESAYRVTGAGLSPVPLPGALMSSTFGDETGLWLALLVRVGDKSVVYVLSGSTGLVKLPDVGNSMPYPWMFVSVVQLWVVEGVMLVDVIGRQYQQVDTNAFESVGRLLHYFFNGTVVDGSGRWFGTNVDLSSFGVSHWYTRLASTARYYFVAQTVGVSSFQMSFAYSPDVPSLDFLEEPTPVSILGSGQYMSQLYQAVCSATAIDPTQVFFASAAGWDWLRVLRVQDGVYNSMQVEMKVQPAGFCDGESCEGCATVQLQRLCLMYNRCAVINCVGTPVNTRRPLCGVGQMLKFAGQKGLQSVSGTWSILSELLASTLNVSTAGVKSLQLQFPEDAFLCSVCSAKDYSAEFFSVLTASVAAALGNLEQKGHLSVSFMLSGASSVDANADALLTLSTTTMTAFLQQLSLWPLFMMVATHQTQMCRTNGLLALLDVTGFSLRLTSASVANTSDVMAGQCLSKLIDGLTRSSADQSTSLNKVMRTMVRDAVVLVGQQSMEPLWHYGDALLSYSLGVVQSFAAFLSSMDMAHCNPPSSLLTSVTKCSCADTPLTVPARAEAHPPFDPFPLWCRGVLTMVDSNNHEYYIYNPYTLEELQAKSAKLQAFVDCMGSSYACSEFQDVDRLLTSQGVTLYNVLVKCRENYQRHRWDPHAYILFQPSLHYLVPDAAAQLLSGWRDLNTQMGGVYDCMQQDPAQVGDLSATCLTNYLAQTEVDWNLYWLYQPAAPGAPAQLVDGCEVFTGPASKGIAAFQWCVDGPEEWAMSGRCSASASLWSYASANAVPVASQHAVQATRGEADTMVHRYYAMAQGLVAAALEQAQAAWSANRVDIVAEMFSAEGDALHQTMDCIFMGPYARFDYWPTPPTQCVPQAGGGADTCMLAGPYWSRDEGGGSARGVDVNACPKENSIPHTCGSPSRRAMMRYFVRQLGMSASANSNRTLLSQAVRAQLANLSQVWLDESRYGCPCPSSPSPSPWCCKQEDSASWLDPALQRPATTLSSDALLMAINDFYVSMYDNAMQSSQPWLLHLAQAERDKYDWAARSPVTVEQDARLSTTSPSFNYTSAEALSPFRHLDTSLWETCHGALLQTLFTLPVSMDGSLLFRTGRAPSASLKQVLLDPLLLQEHIRGLVSEALVRSPMARHYLPRHAPSPSLVCKHEANQAGLSALGIEGDLRGPSSYVLADYAQAGVHMYSGEEAGTFQLYDYRSFSVGEQDPCLCGWEVSASDNSCAIPAELQSAVCDSGLVSCVAGGTRYLRGEDSDARLRSLMSDAWRCPDSEISAWWGSTNPDLAERWMLRDYSTGDVLEDTSEDLLRHGRAGLRVGNVVGLRTLTRSSVDPRARMSEEELRAHQLTSCDYDQRLQAAGYLANATVEELFPMAHAVQEAGAVPYCTRYVLEVARYQALAQVMLEGEDALAAQDAVRRQWLRKCGAQLQLVHLCQSLSVYNRAPQRAVLERSLARCAHFQPFYAPYPAAVATVAYSTPECLVMMDDVAYDPCRCLACAGDASRVLDLTALKADPACRLRMDPRQLLAEGSPMAWWAAASDGAAASNAALASPANLLRHDAARLLLDTRDATGNTPVYATTGNTPVLDTTTGSTWFQSEGFMAQSAADCGLVADWWPEEETFPFGYHPTVPCDSADAAYRSFHTAFVLDYDEAGRPLMRYQHDLMRDALYVDSRFGAGGLCRRGNLGVDMLVTNTMEYCTSDWRDQPEDFTVYGFGHDTSDANAGDWICTGSSASLPWPGHLTSGQTHYESSLFTVGTVPNMPRPGQSAYPASLTSDDLWDTGAMDETRSLNFGVGCSDFDLRTCWTALDCPTSYACRGHSCSESGLPCKRDTECGGVEGSCRGVCLEASSVECVRNSDCPASKLCSALGVCKPPVISVLNALAGANVSLQLYANGSTCAAGDRAFDMLGASYWGNVGENFIHAHGLCSYQDWYRVQVARGTEGCMTNQSDHWELRGKDCPFDDLSGKYQRSVNSTWWPQGALHSPVLYMRPTKCDRDYERVQGFVSCAPTAASGAVIDGASQSLPLQFDRFVKMDFPDHTFRLAPLTGIDDPTYGFLGLGYFQSAEEFRDGTFVTCESLSQCYPYEFTVRGNVTKRTYAPADGSLQVEYPDSYVFRCGAFGYLMEGQCFLDIDVLPLYRFLCVSPYVVQSCVGLAPSAIQQLCAAVPLQYSASPGDRSQVMLALRQLFEVFPAFTDLPGYLMVTQCATDLFEAMRPRRYAGFYYPSLFGLYEFPFAWFYQCVLMAGTDAPVVPDRKGSQDCVAWRLSMAKDAYVPRLRHGDDSLTFLRYVRGGYVEDQVQAWLEGQRGTMQDRVRQVYEATVEHFFPGGGEDESFPQCSSALEWTIGRYGREYTGEASQVQSRLTAEAAAVYSATFPYVQQFRQLIFSEYSTTSCNTELQRQLVEEALALPTRVAKGLARTSNWRAALTVPSADRAFVGPQPSPPRANFEETLITWVVNSMGTRLGTMKMAEVVQAGATGCIYLNLTVESVATGSPPEWMTPTAQTSAIFSGEYEYTLEDRLCDRTCVFSEQDDPTVKYVRHEDLSAVAEAQTGGYTDYVLRKNGSDLVCAAVPVLWKQCNQPAYGCRYLMNGITCTQDTPGCVLDVVSKVSSYVLTQYSLLFGGESPLLRMPVQDFPWFSPDERWGVAGFRGFSLDTVLNHQANIAPDINSPIMCTVITSPADVIDTVSCNNPQYAALKRFAQSQLYHDGHVVVPEQTQLDWTVDRDLLERGVILAYADTWRPMLSEYLAALLDDDLVCKTPTPASTRVCWKPSGSDVYQSINPWTTGYWNWGERCDVGYPPGSTDGKGQYVSSCPSPDICSSSPPTQFYQNMPNRATCPRRNQATNLPNVGVPVTDGNTGEFLPYNLCQHKLVEDVECYADQSLLGGFDGLSVGDVQGDSRNMFAGYPQWAGARYVVKDNLYEPTEWDIPADLRAGVFAQTNPLWAGGVAPSGFLKVPPQDIGVVRIGLLVSVDDTAQSFSNFVVWKLPLSDEDYGRPLDSPSLMSKNVSQWVAGLSALMADEEVVFLGKDTVFVRPHVSASCPLQRLAYYSEGGGRFNPVLPSPHRARHMFRSVNGDRYAHPTMQADDTGQYLGAYRTVNGFCQCPDVTDIPQEQCMIPVGLTGAACSLRETVESLKGNPGLAYASYVFTPKDAQKADRPCTMQLDWPNLPLPLRDGATTRGDFRGGSSVQYQKCHVLDRFAPFRYRYQSQKVLSRGGADSTQQGGVCSTGRVATLDRSVIPTTSDARCVRKVLEGSRATFQCSTPEATTLAAKGLLRRQRVPPLDMYARFRARGRSKCASCAAPPRFVTQTQGGTMAPESSFGVPYRLSAERMLAKDLKEALCAGPGGCPAFNQTAWTPGNFMRAYMLSPPTLFSNATPRNTTITGLVANGSDDGLWDAVEDWVFCPGTEQLRSGQGCQGRMTKQVGFVSWVASASIGFED